MTKYYVYRFLNNKDEIVYVGKTSRDIKVRIAEHFADNIEYAFEYLDLTKDRLQYKPHLSHVQLDQVRKIEYIATTSQIEMDLREIYYINRWKPKFNKKDKNKEEVAEFIKEDREWIDFEKENVKEDSLHFGLSIPFADAFSIEVYQPAWDECGKQSDEMGTPKAHMISSIKSKSNMNYGLTEVTPRGLETTLFISLRSIFNDLCCYHIDGEFRSDFTITIDNEITYLRNSYYDSVSK